MNKKNNSKYILAAAAIVTTLAACSVENAGQGPQGGAGSQITFTATTADVATRSPLHSERLTGYTRDLWLVPYVESTALREQQRQTRGTQLTPESELAGFGVSAYLHGKAVDVTNARPDYFYNLKATKSGDVYQIGQDYYWPSDDERLTFFAYYPYNSGASQAGDYAGAVLSPATQQGRQTIDFTIAAAVTEQVDLMTAVAAGQTPDKANPSATLQFQHELTGVRFIVGDQFLGGWIKNIQLNNVYGRGTLTIGGGWALSDADKTNFSVAYSTNKAVSGTEGEDVTAADETFLMIPQTLGAEGQEVVITYQDAAHNDYTVRAPLTGEWRKGETVTYAISSTDLTTLRVSTIDFPAVSGAPKTAWAAGDQVGLYVVGSDGTTLTHKNVKVTFDGTKWNIAHPEGNPVYHLPGQSYFLYYPYSTADDSQPLGYPEAATSASETADDFFNGVITEHVIASDQREYDNFIASDLCIAKATDDLPASTIKATLARKVGLAVITLGEKDANKKVVFTNGVAGTPTTGKVTATSVFDTGGRKPRLNGTRYYYYTKADVATSFNSSPTEKDAWHEALVFTLAAGATEAKTAYSDRAYWDYIDAEWNYTTATAHTFTSASQGSYTYTLKVWGAQGGDAVLGGRTAYGGRGGYAQGTINLDPGTKLYIGVGGAGEVGNPTTCKQSGHPLGGYNGGRQGGWYQPLQTSWAGSGGCTHIAKNQNLGELRNYEKSKGDVLIVAGAGGGAGAEYRSESNYDSNNMNIRAGGYGGGLEGGKGVTGHSDGVTGVATGGTQTGGGTGYTGWSVDPVAAGKFGLGGRRNATDTGCGGAGWYGGGAAHSSVSTGAGGSSYIGGVNGGSTINGNTNQTQPNGSTTKGHSGNGYARITLTRW